MADLSGAAWRKSSYSAQDGQCVEVATGLPGIVPVRDSKDPQGPTLVLPADAFASFLTSLRAGEFGEV
ncbi:DUF397 domain-containing protein [Kitasatospora sp. NPDC056327]|uniref:DUF397 domain-containing protein n=1 Tax=Kitasatospora sp. NPDC056327 TaxID=3345785 RepID=UPI0035D641A8